MLAHPKIGPTGSATCRGAGPWTVSRTTTTSSAKASGSRYGPSRAASGAPNTPPRGPPCVPGARAATSSLSSAGSWTPDDVRAAGPGLARREQRVEVGVEADGHVRDGAVKSPLREPLRHELRRAAARRGSPSRPIAFQSRATASAAAKATGFDAWSGLSELDARTALRAGQVPAVVLLRPAGRLERLLRRPARSYGDGRIGGRLEQRRGRRDRAPARAARRRRRRSSTIAARSIASSSAVRTAGSRNSGGSGAGSGATAVSVEPG